ncbi:hypothetical protein [Gimesia panareensis]|uniref:Uncharacterized protein n=1 Tax=Gimesia panareensis TaxID=2527978 RepID=A0A518AAG6_9PLAN|nr:hypothetical protein [Gimesia panareensis]QDT28882.1 hypothetical protein Enr10x_42280 [Gimesia panareensis]QDU51729.1 hypothetical protein Pan110_40960 [Gimesia panareensis]
MNVTSGGGPGFEDFLWMSPEMISINIPTAENSPMVNKKQQKKKDREKRVAKKKHLESVKKKTQEKTKQESKQPVTARTQIMQSAVPKGDQGAKGNQKNTFMHRRTGG